MFSFKKLFKRVKIEHNINIIAEFNKSNDSLYEIAMLTDYICDIGDSVQVIHDLQAHPKGYRITFKLTFETPLKDKKKGNKYTHYVARLTNWVSNNDCVQRYQYNYN